MNIVRIVLVYFVVYYLPAIVFIALSRRTFKTRTPAIPFQISIPDLFVLALVGAPLLYVILACHPMDRYRAIGGCGSVFAVGVFFRSQFCWVRHKSGAWQAAFGLLGGSICGYLFMVVWYLITATLFGLHPNLLSD